MSSPLLLLDCPNLMWRAYYAMKSMSIGDHIPTGAVFGFFRDLTFFAEYFGSSRFVFCFDNGIPLRKEFYPSYKVRTEKKILSPAYEQEAKNKREVRRQIERMRDEFLPSLGFGSILHAKGYEADDCIASACLSLEDEDIVILSSDRDLYQCLASNVRIWNPTGKGDKWVTLQSFHRDYHIHPAKWVDVKAIAGCDSDCIKGIKGVGEQSAVKYLSKDVTLKEYMRKRIVAGRGIWELNLDLVSLPYPDCPSFTLREDEPNEGEWRKLCYELEFDSLRGHFPGLRRHTQKGLF